MAEGDAIGCRASRFEVMDRGLDIAEEKQRRLFEAFSQVDESNARQPSDTSLGLAISQQFVLGMGGQQIGVESQLRQGPTFWFELPRAVIEQQPTEEGVEPDVDLQGLRVLLVDGEAASRAIAAGYLQRIGCLMEEAIDGHQAVDKFQPGQYDLILMDL